MRAQLSYRLDNALARGTAPVVGALAVVTIVLVLGAGFVLWLVQIKVNGSDVSDIEGTWDSLMRTLDPGTMGFDTGWPFRLVALVVTLGGILIVSTLIGLIASGIDQRISTFRRGRSRVIESGHILMLGWSPKLATLLTELAVAHRRSASVCVVILAPRDKVEMEDEIHSRIPSLDHLRIVVRTGDPSDPNELAVGAPLTARSVLVLAENDAGDAITVRTVLALAAIGLPQTTPVITELSVHSRATALRSASPLNLHAIVPHDWIARITAQVCRDPALAAVFQDLLDFEGHEIYFVVAPKLLHGHPVSEAVRSIADGAVIGVRHAGNIELAPDPTNLIDEGDDLIVIAETADAARFDVTLAGEAFDDALFDELVAVPEPDHIGIVGWSALGSMLLEQLDQYLPPGSRIDVLVDDRQGSLGPPDVPFQRFELRHSSADTTDVDALRRFLSPASIDRVVVLADRSGCTPGEADARVLLTLLELRQLDVASPLRVVAELLDPRDVELVRGHGTEEFIVGDRLTSLLMAQLAEQGDLSEVFDVLLAADGPAIGLLPAGSVGVIGHETTYRQLVGHLLDRDCYTIGVKSGARIRLTPPGTERISLSSGDGVIVVRADGLLEDTSWVSAHVTSE